MLRISNICAWTDQYIIYLKVDMFPPAVEVRAILEGQFLARRMYAEQGGLLGKLKKEV